MGEHGPQAYMISFRAYGTWLPGDARGWNDRRDNAIGSPLGGLDEGRLDRSRSRLEGPPAVFDAPARWSVGEAIREACQARGWTLHALCVRTEHLHVVVSAPGRPERVMTSLKAWATRRLVANGLIDQGSRVWSRHGSTRYLWTEKEVGDACRYVLEGQGEPLLDDTR